MPRGDGGQDILFAEEDRREIYRLLGEGLADVSTAVELINGRTEKA